MRAVAIVGCLSVVLLAGCGDGDSGTEEDARYFRDGVARACVDSGRGDLADCHEIVDTVIAPNSLPTDANSAELFSIGYSQACTYIYSACDPAEVEKQKAEALHAYED
jgi:hypothetical protein